LLPRLINASNAAEMITGRQFTARECYRMGLVSQIVPADQVQAKALEIAGEMLRCSATSLALTRRALYDGIKGTIDNAMQFEKLAMEHCYQSPEHKEYVSALYGKAQSRLP